MSELKPCPFCGSRNVAQGSSRELISVWCFCGAQGPSVPFPDNCIDPVKPILECHEAWNKRSPDIAALEADNALLVEERDRLRKALEPFALGKHELRNTHLLEWLTGGFVHCKYGSEEWAQAYLDSARDYIKAFEGSARSALEATR